MLDSDFIKAQFESAMKLVDWAVSKCVERSDAALMDSMLRQLTKQSRFLERKMREPQLPRMREPEKGVSEAA